MIPIDRPFDRIAARRSLLSRRTPDGAGSFPCARSTPIVARHRNGAERVADELRNALLDTAPDALAEPIAARLIAAAS